MCSDPTYTNWSLIEKEQDACLVPDKTLVIGLPSNQNGPLTYDVLFSRHLQLGTRDLYKIIYTKPRSQ